MNPYIKLDPNRIYSPEDLLHQLLDYKQLEYTFPDSLGIKMVSDGFYRVAIACDLLVEGTRCSKVLMYNLIGLQAELQPKSFGKPKQEENVNAIQLIYKNVCQKGEPYWNEADVNEKIKWDPNLVSPQPPADDPIDSESDLDIP